VKITAPTVLCAGMTAKPTSRGFVSVDLGIEADPETFTPALVERAMIEHGCRRRADGSWFLSWSWRMNYLRDFDAQTGQRLFAEETLALQQPNLRNPLRRMDLDHEGLRLIESRQGRVYVYCEPDAQPDEYPEGVVSVARTVGIGMDVGLGTGASGSAGYGMFGDTREQAVEFHDNETSPNDFGRLAVAVAKYYNDALVCCVGKMHGMTTIRTMVDELHYPHLWHHRMAQRQTERETAKLGWMKGEASDPRLFDDWNDALAKGGPVVHSVTALGQHREWVYDHAGHVCHRSLTSATVNERLLHADLVVAAALSWRACADLPHFRAVQKRPKTGMEIYLAKRQTKENGVWRR
jgi:hypothetical protein